MGAELAWIWVSFKVKELRGTDIGAQVWKEHYLSWRKAGWWLSRTDVYK
jgi:hypothetical protein